MNQLESPGSQSPRFDLSLVGLTLLGFILFISIEVLITVTALQRSNWEFLLLFFLPFGFYCVISFLIHKYQKSLVNTKHFVTIIVIVATIVQIRLLILDVTLSDDIYRFFIEGKALIHGINPYITPPTDYLVDIQPSFIDLINNPNVTSPYPPLAIIMFTLLYLIHSDPLFFRIMFSIAYIASIPLMARLLSVFYQPQWRVILYAWNPLLHIETGNGSHFDPIVVFAVMFAIYALNRERHLLGGITLLVATLLKYYPIFLIIIYWRQLGRRGRTTVISGLSLYGLVIILIPPVISGLLIYAERWYFNTSIMWVLVELTNSFFGAKVVVGVVFLIIFLLVSYRSAQDPHILNPMTALIVLASFLLLQPVFHPWYLFWIFPFVLLVNPLDFSWILLTGTVILSYHVYIGFDTLGIWVESDLIRIVEFLPFFASLLYIYHEKLKSYLRKQQLPVPAAMK